MFGNLALNAQVRLKSILESDDWLSTHKIQFDIRDNNGDTTSIPVAIIKGKKKGPVFSILAGVHGFEYPPIIAAQELIQEISPDSLIGTVIIIPIANLSSFYSRTPFLNPQDNLNLNRIFPGNINGSVTEKIAHFITTEIIAHSDVFVDMHGGDANEDLLPFLCYYNNTTKAIQTSKAKALSETSGFEYIVSYPYTIKDDEPAKYAFKQAVQDGIVGLSIECGKLGNLHQNAVVKIKSAVKNMLTLYEIYPQNHKSKTAVTYLNEQTYIKAEHQGIFVSDLVAGDRVVKGTIIGQINNEFGDKIIEIMAPETGIILYKIGTPPVNLNETLVCIGMVKN